jgi:hypothetical protein
MKNLRWLRVEFEKYGSGRAVTITITITITITSYLVIVYL